LQYIFVYTCVSNQLRKFHGDIYYFQILPYSPVVPRIKLASWLYCVHHCEPIIDGGEIKLFLSSG